jgi:2-haloacid dehalogenase
LKEYVVSLNRRTFVQLSAAALFAGAVVSGGRAAGSAPLSIKAIAFDGFAVFDPRPIFMLAEQLFPGRGAELGDAWRTRQFEYAWQRTLLGRYRDFWHVTQDALVFSAKLLKLDLRADQRDRLMQAYLEIKAWPDALPTMQSLKAAGLRMAFLANLTAEMIDAGVRNSGLEGLLEPHLSTDRVRAYKPDPRAYQMGVDAFGVSRNEIVFVAFGGWDVAGAKAFGYPTYWANRLGLPIEELGLTPDGMGPGLRGLEAFCRSA